MTRKDKLKNDIIIALRNHLDKTQQAMLENVLTKALYNVDVADSDNLPATLDVTNEYIIDMFKARKAPKLSIQTVKAYLGTLLEFIRCVGKSLLHVEEIDVEFYLLRKQKEGNSNVSLNNCRRNLSAIFTWMRKCRLIQFNPAENIEKYREIEKPIDHLEAAEIEQLKAGCRTKRDRALLEWLRCTAMRGGEIPSVTINQINWQTGAVTIYGQKGHAYRPVYLDNVALKFIREYLESRGETMQSSNPLFTHNKGNLIQPLRRESICTSIKEIANRAGLERRVYTHLFRKTTATNIVKRGGSESDAGEYLGHKPQGVTGRHYTYKSEDHMARIFSDYVAAV